MSVVREAPQRKFTVDDVERMVAAGVLSEGEPLELLAGRLVVVSPQGPSHSYMVTRLAELLRRVAPDATLVREEKPLELGPFDLPEPDVALVAGAAEDYRDRHPSGRDALLAVEVAVTSHALDRAKAKGYGAGGVATCWLVDVPGRRVEVHMAPGPDGYERVDTLGPNDRLTLPGADRFLAVADLFG